MRMSKEARMRGKALAIAVAIGGLAIPGIANAAPTAPSPAAGIASQPEFLPVRDGCGRGYYLAQWQDRWGRWHRRCVPVRGRGVPRWRHGWGDYRR
jgi:hypothetical protein